MSLSIRPTRSGSTKTPSVRMTTWWISAPAKESLGASSVKKTNTVFKPPWTSPGTAPFKLLILSEASESKRCVLTKVVPKRRKSPMRLCQCPPKSEVPKTRKFCTASSGAKEPVRNSRGLVRWAATKLKLLLRDEPSQRMPLKRGRFRVMGVKYVRTWSPMIRRVDQRPKPSSAMMSLLKKPSYRPLRDSKLPLTPGASRRTSLNSRISTPSMSKSPKRSKRRFSSSRS